MDLKAIYANALITADGAQIVMHRRPETEAAHLAGLEAVRRAVIEECRQKCRAVSTEHFATREQYIRDDVDRLEIVSEEGAYKAADECERALHRLAEGA